MSQKLEPFDIEYLKIVNIDLENRIKQMQEKGFDDDDDLLEAIEHISKAYVHISKAIKK